MYILGLTGSIGMGKSFAANEFAKLGVPVFDADAAVHRLMAPQGKAVERIARLFPESIKHGRLDRKYLSDVVFSNKRLLAQLESVIHPLVSREQAQFLRNAARMKAKLVVLDIPLLFEKNYQISCDAVALVSASLLIQRWRVLKRPHMTEQKLLVIRRLQMPEGKKKTKADYIIFTGQGKCTTRRKIRQIVRGIHRGDNVKKTITGNHTRYRNNRIKPL